MGAHAINNSQFGDGWNPHKKIWWLGGGFWHGVNPTFIL
jgi:hypothetical protein